MQITFLGTGTSQGIPVIGCTCDVCTSFDHKDKRLRTSVMISENGKNYVIDVGPDFRQQMLTTGIDTLEAVLLTHEHNDHVIGLDDLRPFIFRSRKRMSIYGLERVLEEIKERFKYAFVKQPYPGAPSFELVNIDESKDLEIGALRITPVRVEHGPLPILGYRIKDFAYLTDVKSILDEEKEKLHNLDVLVLDALHRTPHHSHLSLEESLDLIQELKPKKAYLIHLSHRMGKHQDIANELPKDVFITYDGLIINV